MFTVKWNKSPWHISHVPLLQTEHIRNVNDTKRMRLRNAHLDSMRYAVIPMAIVM